MAIPTPTRGAPGEADPPRAGTADAALSASGEAGRDGGVGDATGTQIDSLSNRRGQAVLGVFTFAHFAHHLSNSLLSPMLPLIRDAFGLGYAQSGLLVSALSLSQGLSNAPVGVLADRIGPRRVMVVGLVLTGMISAAIAYAGEYWHLLALLVVMGVVAGSYHAPAASVLVRVFAPNLRGAAIGFHFTGGHLSFFALPLAAAYLSSVSGTWRTPFLVLAFAPVVMAVLLCLLAPADPARRAVGGDRWAVFREVGTVIRLVGPLVSISILAQVIHAALLAFTALYLVDARGIPAPLAAVFFGVPQLAGMLGAPVGGFLSDRFGRRAVLVLGVGLLGPGFLALSLVPNELLVLPLLVTGIAGSMRITATEVFVTESAPAHRRATVLGGYYMLSQELGGLAAPILGLLAAAVGIGLAFGSASALLAVASVVALVLYRRS